MATHTVIMFPGEWETEEEAFRVAQALSPILEEMPFDIAKRMRDTGFAILKTKPHVASRIVDAVRGTGYRAASIADPVQPWRYPEVRFAGKVTFEGDSLLYEAGKFRDTLGKDDVQFLHLCCFPHHGTGLTDDDSGRSEAVCIDLHCREPRTILRMDLKTSRYGFLDDGDDRIGRAQPKEVLGALNRFAHGKVILPDPRLMTTSIDGAGWDDALLPNQATLRSKGTWYLRLAETGQLKDVAEEAHRSALGSGATARVTASHVATAAAEGGEYSDQIRVAEKWLRRGLVNRALQEVERAIAMKPDHGEGYLIRAEIHVKGGDGEQANRDRARARELGAS